ncbi:MAG: ABC transporter ATP-binding protein [Candidatus Hodarchaeales archaeon]
MTTADPFSSRPTPRSGFTDHRRWLIHRALQGRKIVALGVIIGTLITIVLEVASPVIIGMMIDRLLESPTQADKRAAIIFLTGAFLLLGLIKVITDLSTSAGNAFVGQSLERDIREELFEAVAEKNMAFHTAASHGELLALATNDSRQISFMVSPGLRRITQALITGVGALAVIFLISPLLGVLVLLIFPLYYLALRGYNSKLADVSRKQQMSFRKVNAILQENIQGAPIVRAFSGEDHERKLFEDELENLRHYMRRRGRIAAFYIPMLILFGAIGFIFLVGAELVARGDITIGELIAVNGLLISMRLPTMILSFALTITQLGLAGSSRILNVINEEQVIEDGSKPLEHPQGKIMFENVSFSYDGKRDVLRDINLIIKPGQTIALLGPTGCGKTTLTNLITRLYEPTSGSVKIDGTDIQELTLESLRSNIGVVEQEIFLFSTSIRENIIYGKHDATKEEIEHAARLAQAHEFITSFKDGYETVVGERGMKLSGGQKQRIALARAFLSNPKILILDDATSAVDSETENTIAKAINRLLEGRTTFIITHRLAQIRSADLIVLMKNGRIAVTGQHESLIRESLDYRRIFAHHINLPDLQTTPPRVGVQVTEEGR